MANTLRPRSVALFLGVLTLVVATASACFWDSDTLRAEARGLPAAPAIIVGATERFPPQYYERRIEIARQRLGAWAQFGATLRVNQPDTDLDPGSEAKPTAAASSETGPDLDAGSDTGDGAESDAQLRTAASAGEVSDGPIDRSLAGTPIPGDLPPLPADPRGALESFDNLAVASDRLGDSPSAFAALAGKRVLLDRLADARVGVGGSGVSESAAPAEGGRTNRPACWTDHDYRYHANLGTIYAHRWVRAGAPREGERALADLEHAREHIARAIEINPDAHFGREPVQLAVIEWLMNDPEDEECGPDSWLMVESWDTVSRRIMKGSSADRDAETAAIIEGLIGLIALGQAWESVDVFLLLHDAARRLSHSSLALLAQTRAHELAAAGQPPLHPDLRAYINEHGIPRVWGYSLTETDRSSVLDWYAKARAKADEWQTEHEAWVRGQLAKGLHPDLDPEAFGEFPRAKLPHEKRRRGFGDCYSSST